MEPFSPAAEPKPKPKQRKRTQTVDYDLYLFDGETTNPAEAKHGMALVKVGTLRKRKHDAEKNLSKEERGQLQEERREKLHEASVMRRDDLRFFGESGYDHDAETHQEEIHIHRLFLQRLEQPDVQPGETLRQLAKRTWSALLTVPGTGVSIDGDHGWFPGFNPVTGRFSFYGWRVKNVGKPNWFDQTWQPPNDCTGDERIDIRSLPALPPRKRA